MTTALLTGRLPEFLRLAMLGFAESIMAREPDFTLGGYMERWHVRPRGAASNCYVHRFSGSDSDRALHDHPYDNVTCVLRGNYREHFHVKPLRLVHDGEKYDTYSVLRAQGDVIERPATTLHRVAMTGPDPVVTLFFVGPRMREWGFLTPTDGWIKWSDYERAYAPQIEADQRARMNK